MMSIHVPEQLRFRVLGAGSHRMIQNELETTILKGGFNRGLIIFGRIKGDTRSV